MSSSPISKVRNIQLCFIKYISFLILVSSICNAVSSNGYNTLPINMLYFLSNFESSTAKFLNLLFFIELLII